MDLRVTYLKLGVKNAQTLVIRITLQDASDYGTLGSAMRIIGCLQSDIREIEEI